MCALTNFDIIVTHWFSFFFSRSNIIHSSITPSASVFCAFVYLIGTRVSLFINQSSSIFSGLPGGFLSPIFQYFDTSHYNEVVPQNVQNVPQSFLTFNANVLFSFNISINEAYRYWISSAWLYFLISSTRNTVTVYITVIRNHILEMIVWNHNNDLLCDSNRLRETWPIEPNT